MPYFSTFKKAFYNGRKAQARRNRNESKVAKLIDPNYGRIVTLQVLVEEPGLQMAIDMLKSVADGKNTKAEVSGNKVTLTFSDATCAEAFRSAWKD